VKHKKRIEVCLTNSLFGNYETENRTVVVADILRATTAVCTAFKNGAEKLIPVSTVAEARKMKEKGYIVAAEREGEKLDFADYGNSPFNFTEENVKGKTIVYSTTNGTSAMQMAGGASLVVIGSFINLSSLCGWLNEKGMAVTVLCAGRKGRFCLEDAVFAGALCEKLIQTGNFYSACDSAFASMTLWSSARSDLKGYLENARQRHRLKKKGLDNILDYTYTPDTTSVVPVLTGNCLVGYEHALQNKLL